MFLLFVQVASTPFFMASQWVRHTKRCGGLRIASHIAIDMGTTPSSGLLLQMILYDEASDIWVQSAGKGNKKEGKSVLENQ